MEDLTPEERRILAFEQRRWNRQGAKDEAVAVELGMSRVRYDQALGAIINKPAALIAEPMLVKRLRRLRETRRRLRSA